MAAQQPAGPWTALKATTSEAGCALWFYDWQEGRLREDAPVTALIGWREDLDGFLVVVRSPPHGLQFDVKRP